ncbi:EamA family transporter [Neobacillus mesonae]|nr:EamA family transporter [Neobacillus mesonae]
MRLLLAYISMCLIFGTTFLAIKVGNDAGVPPFYAAGIRFCLAGAILFIGCLWSKKTSLKLLLQKEVIIIGSCLTFMTFAGLYYGEQYISSGVAAVLSATGPIMIIWIQAWVLKKKAGALSLLGCLTAFAGVILILVPELTMEAGGMWLTGACAVLVGEVFYASGSVYSGATGSKLSTHSPLAVNGAQMLYGGLMLLVVSFVTEQPEPSILLSTGAAGSVLYLTVFGSMIGHSLFYYLVTKTGPLFPSTWLYISPMIALGIGMLFYGERVTMLTVLGAVIIIAGLILANWHTLKEWILFKNRQKKRTAQQSMAANTSVNR